MSEIAPSILKAVDQDLIQRYSTRLAKFGQDPRTLGWDKLESQHARFDLAARSVDFADRTVLDVGCGLADLYDFLIQRPAVPAAYAGCDINAELLAQCRQRQPHNAFYQANLLTDQIPGAPFDIVTLFGVLNFRFKEFSNEDFSRGMIRQAFKLCREAVIVDMLSAFRDEKYPEEDFVYYYDPSAMLHFALTLTPHVMLRHDYSSIPQREMMLILRRDPCE